MCTSLAFSSPALFGRNLDLEYSFSEQVAVTPRNHAFSFRHRPPLAHHFALIGMAAVAGDVPLYAEAANEKGLYMAGLYFPGNAHYFPDTDPQRDNLAPYELIPAVLGACETLAEARRMLERVRLIADPFAPGYPLAPLHWHIADATGSLVAEPMADGLRLYDDPAGVLTNNPPFPFHLTRLSDYQTLSPRPPENRFAPALGLQPYGQGMGAMGLPGDASPVSRFVRAAFLKAHAAFDGDEAAQVVQFFPHPGCRLHGARQRRHARRTPGRDDLLLLLRRAQRRVLLPHLRRQPHQRRQPAGRTARRRGAARLPAGAQPAIPLCQPPYLTPCGGSCLRFFCAARRKKPLPFLSSQVRI